MVIAYVQGVSKSFTSTVIVYCVRNIEKDMFLLSVEGTKILSKMLIPLGILNF